MTSGERASLERLEDKFDHWAERFDNKIEDIDVRLRNVETTQAQHLGAIRERKDASTSRIQTAGVVLAGAVVLIALPAAVVAVTTLVSLVSG